MWLKGVLVLLVGLLVAGVGSASAASPDQIQAFLNQQRASNAIPGVGFDASLSGGCDKHNNYMQLNHFSGPNHGESPGRPGYTQEGANPPGEVLASQLSRAFWSPVFNPWVDAPIHLAIAFDPQSNAAGGADTHGFQCLRTDGFREFAGPTLNLFTGPQGRTNVPLTVQTENEAPFAPQQLLDFPPGRTTGYQLIAWAYNLGPAPGPYQVMSAALAGPSGPVDLRVVDSRYGAWHLPNAAVLIPVQAFASDATYTGQVTWGGSDGQPYTMPFSFRTEPLQTVSLKLSRLRVVGPRSYGLTLSSPKSAVGQRAQVRVYWLRRGSRSVIQRKTIRRLHRTQALRLQAHKGRLRVVVSIKAFTRAGVRYAKSSTAFELSY